MKIKKKRPNYCKNDNNSNDSNNDNINGNRNVKNAIIFEIQTRIQIETRLTTSSCKVALLPSLHRQRRCRRGHWCKTTLQRRWRRRGHWCKTTLQRRRCRRRRCNDADADADVGAKRRCNERRRRRRSRRQQPLQRCKRQNSMHWKLVGNGALSIAKCPSQTELNIRATNQRRKRPKALETRSKRKFNIGTLLWTEALWLAESGHVTWNVQL